MTARFRRCGHGSGPMYPGDQKAVAEFTAMLAARQRPAPWTGRGDVAVRIGERGLERGRLPQPPCVCCTRPLFWPPTTPGSGSSGCPFPFTRKENPYEDLPHGSRSAR